MERQRGLARESYVGYFDLMRTLRPPYPVHTVPGNHDDPARGETDEYLAAFGPRNWWFVHRDCLFVGIDNSKGEPTRGAREVLRQASR